MAILNEKKNLHLLWRAGFGPSAKDLANLGTIQPGELFRQLLQASEASPVALNAGAEDYQAMVMDTEATVLQRKQLDAEQRRELRIKSREGLKTLNLAWLQQMIDSPQQLREKMSLFWHGHFATRTVNLLHQQKLLAIIRNGALGNFGDLLKQVSTSAAMINFLNNNQNRKGHPNENFAREVMELFTLGRGQYTENDIKESARAFTGWGATPTGDFVFRERQHDDGEKTFQGRTGHFNGEDILNIILEQKQTASFICRKIYIFFVNAEPDESRIAWLASRFYDHKYDIRSLLQDIFSSEWFYNDSNIGSKIKSPIELLAGIQRMLPMTIKNEASQLLLQRLLGQVLFYPPNVAGWPGGKNWIDSSTLMLRLRIPQLLYAGDALSMKPKDDDDQMMGMHDADNARLNEQGGAGGKSGGGRAGQQLIASINWPAFISEFAAVKKDDLPAALSAILLQTRNGIDTATLLNHVNAATREDFIKTAAIQLMSTPEYQIC